MKINPDCIRDVMLVLEEKLSFRESTAEGFEGFLFWGSVRVDKLVELMSETCYSKFDIVYSALQLSESKYIVTDVGKLYDEGDRLFFKENILYITPKGHEFIASIHDKETWGRKISPILQQIGSVSLSVIESVSKGIADAAIEKLVKNFPADML